MSESRWVLFRVAGAAVAGALLCALGSIPGLASTDRVRKIALTDERFFSVVRTYNVDVNLVRHLKLDEFGDPVIDDDTGQYVDEDGDLVPDEEDGPLGTAHIEMTVESQRDTSFVISKLNLTRGPGKARVLRSGGRPRVGAGSDSMAPGTKTKGKLSLVKVRWDDGDGPYYTQVLKWSSTVRLQGGTTVVMNGRADVFGESEFDEEDEDGEGPAPFVFDRSTRISGGATSALTGGAKAKAYLESEDEEPMTLPRDPGRMQCNVNWPSSNSTQGTAVFTSPRSLAGVSATIQLREDGSYRIKSVPRRALLIVNPDGSGHVDIDVRSFHLFGGGGDEFDEEEFFYGFQVTTEDELAAEDGEGSEDDEEF